MTKAEWSGWAQAIGATAAILLSWRLAKSASIRANKEREDRNEAVRAMVKLLRQHFYEEIQRICHMARIQGREAYIYFQNRPVDKFFAQTENLLYRLPLHDMPSAKDLEDVREVLDDMQKLRDALPDRGLEPHVQMKLLYTSFGRYFQKAEKIVRHPFVP